MDEFIYKYSRNMAADMYNRELFNGSVWWDWGSPVLFEVPFFSKLLNLKELSFFVVCKKKYIFIKHEDSKSERRKRDQICFKAIKHQYILFCISEWIKNKPSFKCWFSTIEETIFLFFFWQCFYDLLRMIKQSKSGVRVGTINRRITAPSQRPVDRKSREVKPPDSSSNGCCQIL